MAIVMTSQSAKNHTGTVSWVLHKITWPEICCWVLTLKPGRAQGYNKSSSEMATPSMMPYCKESTDPTSHVVMTVKYNIERVQKLFLFLSSFGHVSLGVLVHMYQTNLHTSSLTSIPSMNEKMKVVSHGNTSSAETKTMKPVLWKTGHN